ncbi:MAG: pyridoxamine 5-phosphate oxidase [Gammaproteobacteria bacterium]|nr:MAG: pyridoxamine 5-phosphate oxidase [Gammaproteobacteria bacterium]
MTQTEREAFLAALHVGVLAIPSDGAPLTAPIWYDYAPGGDIWVLTGPNSRKGRLLSEGLKVTMVAQQEELPYAYVSVEGTVTAIEPQGNGDTQQMAIRYLGEELGKQYAQANAAGESVRVTIRPDRWLTVDYAKSS